MIEGFEQTFVDVNSVSLSVHHGGSGPPLLLLHGYPENHATWRKVAPAFAGHFSCVVPDLRGYGQSSVPTPDTAHRVYSKRTMAADMLALMQHLGHSRFYVLGHDRGARVAYRLALDTEAVSRLGIIDVIPTGDMWQHFDAAMALNAYHWPFLAQPHPLPETLIGSQPDYYLDHTLKSWTGDGTLAVFDPATLESYRAQMRDPARVQAMCEDYRAGATIDRELDNQDSLAGKRITAPLFFLWSNNGFPDQAGDPIKHWAKWAGNVQGTQIVSGHFAQEENPAFVIKSFVEFFNAALSTT